MLIVRHEARREREVGAEAPLADPALLVFGLIVVACLAINSLADSDAAWGYAVVLGWLAIAAVLPRRAAVHDRRGARRDHDRRHRRRAG